MPTSTTNYALQKPLVNNAADQDLWGDEINSDLDSIDTLLKSGITSLTIAETANFTAVASISVKNFYLCDATGGAITATLTVAATAGNGATLSIKKTDVSVNAVTIDGSGSETIDGSLTYVLSSQNQSATLVCDGTNWKVQSTSAVNVPDASTSVKGIIQLATNAETATATNSLKSLVPSSVLYSPGAAKAWAKFTCPGAVISSGYNVASVTRTALGRYTINFTVPFATADYAPIITQFDSVTSAAVSAVTAQFSGSMSIEFFSSTTGAFTDPTFGYIVIHGNF